MPETTTNQPRYTYEYFLSYCAFGHGHQQFSNCTVTRQRPITSMDDVQQITRDIVANYGVNKPMILSFNLLRRIPVAQP